MITRDGYRTTVEAARASLARLWALAWASIQLAWAQLKLPFGG